MPITPEQARAELARRELDRRSGNDPQQSSQGPFQEIRNLKGLSPMQKVLQGLKIPEQMSRRGLTSAADMMPNSVTENLPRDIAVNAPRIATETMAQVAPGFVSRGAMLTAGALKGLKAASPALSALRRGAFSQLESASGSNAGSLEAAYKDPSLIFSKGKEAAKPLYEAAQKELPAMVKESAGLNPFKGMYKPEQIVDKAREILDKGGTLEPSEALRYRKAVDILAKSGRYVKDEIFAMRQEADQLAKESQNIAKADPIHARGAMAQSLRNFLPQNKYGGASAFKMGIVPALTGLGGFVGGTPGAAVGGLMAAGTLSPAVQGVAATGLGVASRAIAPLLENPQIGALIAPLLENPQIGALIAALLKKIRNNENPNPQ